MGSDPKLVGEYLGLNDGAFTLKLVGLGLFLVELFLERLDLEYFGGSVVNLNSCLRMCSSMFTDPDLLLSLPSRVEAMVQ